jgi:uncharacterized protein HemX
MLSVIGARVSQFLASKAVTIALLAALAGGGAYMYFEIKETGRLEARADELRRTLEQNERERQRLAADNAKRQNTIAQQNKDLSLIRRNLGAVQARIDHAYAQAEKALRDCMAMSIADGMRFGPSVQDPDGQADAGTGLDG